MPPAKSMAATMPPEEGSCDEVTMDNISGCQAESEHGEQVQMQQSADHRPDMVAHQAAASGDEAMQAPPKSYEPSQVEALMSAAGIKYGDFHSPADYSSDEEEIARSKDMMLTDLTAAIKAFNLGYKKELVHNARRESLAEGYCSEDDSD
jgi:hypothetical protein